MRSLINAVVRGWRDLLNLRGRFLKSSSPSRGGVSAFLLTGWVRGLQFAAELDVI